jgi:hypothetical protein
MIKAYVLPPPPGIEARFSAQSHVRRPDDPFWTAFLALCGRTVPSAKRERPFVGGPHRRAATNDTSAGATSSAGSRFPTGMALICRSRMPTPSSSRPPVAVIAAI